MKTTKSSQLTCEVQLGQFQEYIAASSEPILEASLTRPVSELRDKRKKVSDDEAVFSMDNQKLTFPVCELTHGRFILVRNHMAGGLSG